jgi:hypothetical protein
MEIAALAKLALNDADRSSRALDVWCAIAAVPDALCPEGQLSKWAIPTPADTTRAHSMVFDESACALFFLLTFLISMI